MESRYNGFEDMNDTIFISHGDRIEDGNMLQLTVKEKFGEKEILILIMSDLLSVPIQVLEPWRFSSWAAQDKQKGENGQLQKLCFPQKVLKTSVSSVRNVWGQNT